MSQEEVIVELLYRCNNLQLRGPVHGFKTFCILCRHLTLQPTFSREGEHLREGEHALRALLFTKGNTVESFVLITEHEHRVREGFCLRYPVTRGLHFRFGNKEVRTILQRLLNKIIEA